MPSMNPAVPFPARIVRVERTRSITVNRLDSVTNAKFPSGYGRALTALAKKPGGIAVDTADDTRSNFLTDP
jgi:hypothetical protein